MPVGWSLPLLTPDSPPLPPNVWTSAIHPTHHTTTPPPQHPPTMVDAAVANLSLADKEPAVEMAAGAEVGENASLAKLQALGVAFKLYQHAEATTIEEQAQHVGHLPGVLTKNLLLRDKKIGTFLITALHDRPTDTKTLAKLLKLGSKANLRFADEPTLEALLGVKRGAVSALAVLNDADKAVTLVLDKALLEQPTINLHPLRNDRTVSIPSAALREYVRAAGHEPVVVDFDSVPAAAPAPAPGPKKEKKPSDGGSDGVAATKKAAAAPPAGQTLLGIDVSKKDDFALWYTRVITYSEMIDYYDISGCYILRPWAYSIWETIQRWFDDEIKELGVENAYFPLFVSKAALEREKDHVEGFAPEVAWVTKSGDSDLPEPIAVRPTSETIMYPLYKKWIRSHRDLPLCLNQWSNVVRWEFKYPTPFLRSREFLWQEGHTAHASFEESQVMVMDVLDLYRRVYEELLAVPVIKGRKTEMERFPGGHITTTVEAYINGSGRSIQGATSHNLGQNFGKMFDIQYEDKAGGHAIPWQTSWGITTRTIGVMVMAHGDDKGLVLPPRVAPKQVVVIPIVKASLTEEAKAALQEYATTIVAGLKAAKVRVHLDARDNYTPGWKYNHWEQKGVPLRLEVGPLDLEKRTVRMVRRDTGAKADLGEAAVVTTVVDMLEEIQAALFAKSKAERDEKLVRVLEWKDFVPALNRQCIVLTPFCNETEWEEEVKRKSREEALDGEAEDDRTSTSVAAKTLCIPFEQPDLPAGTKCFVSGKDATCWVLWGRSY